MKEKLKMTLKGLEEQKLKLEKLKLDFIENEKEMTQSFANSNGDGAHDNAEFEFLLAKERMLVSQINEQINKINNVEIIEVVEMEEDCVNIGDTIDINMLFDLNDEEEITIELVGSEYSTEGEVSINSPLGKAIYGKKIGDMVSYNVNDNEIVVKILRKTNVRKL